MSTTTRPTGTAPATATIPVTASSPVTAPAADNTTEPMWIPISKLIIGVLVVLAALTFAEHINEPIDTYGYVPVMFFYVIVMIIGGGLMVSGFMTLWRTTTTPPNSR